MSADAWFEANRRRWDERVPIHYRSSFYDVAGFLAGASSLEPHELAEVGDVGGKSLLHLQCHFGLDTLSWARLGARVTGLDFSGEGIRAARELAAEADISAEFVEANLYDAPAALAGRAFDIVYTGKGALIWLPDLDRWAEVVAGLLAPGGLCYVLDMHPVGYLFDEREPVLDPCFRYFSVPEPRRWDEPGSYADPDAATRYNESYEWSYTIGSVVTAIARAGLVVEFLHEFDHTVYRAFPFMRREGRVWKLPAGSADLPLMFSIRARKPV